MEDRWSISSLDNQLSAAIDTEDGLLPSRCGVLGLAALLRVNTLVVNTLVDDVVTDGVMADGCIRPPMIQVLAWVEPS
jgi:hypothetical protein